MPPPLTANSQQPTAPSPYPVVGDLVIADLGHGRSVRCIYRKRFQGLHVAHEDAFMGLGWLVLDVIPEDNAKTNHIQRLILPPMQIRKA